MTISLKLPSEIEEALGPNPQQEVLESVLLRLIRRQVISVAKAGEVLGLNRQEAIQWYLAQGYRYPDYSPQDWADELAAIQRLRS
jgi:predicted HTH domain antitoxin